MKENDYINELALKFIEAYETYQKSDYTTRSGYNKIKADMYELIDQYYEEGKITDASYDAVRKALEDFHEHYVYTADGY